MHILTRDLPEITRRRLGKAIATPDNDTFYFSKSKRGWATALIAGALVCAWIVLNSANGNRWSGDTRKAACIASVVAFGAGLWGTRYWLRWIRSDFKDFTLINPFYCLRVEFDEIDAHILLDARDVKINHSYDKDGRFDSTTIKLVFEDGVESLTIKKARTAYDLVEALKRFAQQVPDWFEKQDAGALYSVDLLYEFRKQEEDYAKVGARPTPPKGLKLLSQLLTICLGLFAGIAFYVLSDRFNDYRDDEIRWRTTSAAGTAIAFRLYIAQRPTGRHVVEASVRLQGLYDRAATDYREAAGIVTSQGIEAVISMLEYARRTAKYAVGIRFEANNRIPHDIEDRLRSRYGVSRLIPILPYFSPQSNLRRESQVVRRVTSAFGKVIPADILDFRSAPSVEDQINFWVSYVIKPAGGLYFRDSEKLLPEQQREYYTGIAFEWRFHIDVPGQNEHPFEFSFRSEPAEVFQVRYSRRDASPTSGPSAIEVYDAMAESAFEDFSKKLLSELSVSPIDVPQP